MHGEIEMSSSTGTKGPWDGSAGKALLLPSLLTVNQLLKPVFTFTHTALYLLYACKVPSQTDFKKKFIFLKSAGCGGAFV